MGQQEVVAHDWCSAGGAVVWEMGCGSLVIG